MAFELLPEGISRAWKFSSSEGVIQKWNHAVERISLSESAKVHQLQHS
jgi:hypothetical protein